MEDVDSYIKHIASDENTTYDQQAICDAIDAAKILSFALINLPNLNFVTITKVLRRILPTLSIKLYFDESAHSVSVTTVNTHSLFVAKKKLRDINIITFDENTQYTVHISDDMSTHSLAHTAITMILQNTLYDNWLDQGNRACPEYTREKFCDLVRSIQSHSFIFTHLPECAVNAITAGIQRFFGTFKTKVLVGIYEGTHDAMITVLSNTMPLIPPKSTLMIDNRKYVIEMGDALLYVPHFIILRRYYTEDQPIVVHPKTSTRTIVRIEETITPVEECDEYYMVLTSGNTNSIFKYATSVLSEQFQPNRGIYKDMSYGCYRIIKQVDLNDFLAIKEFSQGDVAAKSHDYYICRRIINVDTTDIAREEICKLRQHARSFICDISYSSYGDLYIYSKLSVSLRKLMQHIQLAESLDNKICIAHEIIKCFAELHSNDIAHGDINLDTIRFSNDMMGFDFTCNSQSRFQQMQYELFDHDNAPIISINSDAVCVAGILKEIFATQQQMLYCEPLMIELIHAMEYGVITLADAVNHPVFKSNDERCSFIVNMPYLDDTIQLGMQDINRIVSERFIRLDKTPFIGTCDNTKLHWMKNMISVAMSNLKLTQDDMCYIRGKSFGPCSIISLLFTETNLAAFVHQLYLLTLRA